MSDDHSSEPALTASNMVEHFGYDLELADSVVLIYDAALIPARATSRKQRQSKHPFRQVGSLAEDVDVVLAAGPGAPVAAITMELLAAFGVSRVVSIGSAGHLGRNGTAPVGQHFVIERAESDEGTSAHYSEHLAADVRLTAALLERLGGQPHIALTTDVPFRHTPERLAAHRQRADIVEMECAALFAAANHFGIAAAAVLVISDLFTGDTWRYVGGKAPKEAAHQARRAACDVLTQPR